MKSTTTKTIDLAGREIEYQLRISSRARRLRVQVGMDGVEVVQPMGIEDRERDDFLRSKERWILRHLARVERERRSRVPRHLGPDEILYRGRATRVRVREVGKQCTNKIIMADRTITILRGSASRATPSGTLENWLRAQARQEIHRQVEALKTSVHKQPRKISIRGQRTRWGSCSSRGNLSFNWRLIMAPEYVLRYMVVHEMVHLDMPNHSVRYWRKVRSLCPEADRARQWLEANSDRLMIDLRQVC
jgi:predicted metal-dependent hydrolase